MSPRQVTVNDALGRFVHQHDERAAATPLKVLPSLSGTIGWAPRSMMHVADAMALDVVPGLIAMATDIMRVVPAIHCRLDDVGARVGFDWG
jgi:hypothetical protein